MDNKTTFQWTEKEVSELITFIGRYEHGYPSNDTIIQHFKESKQPLPEQPKVPVVDKEKEKEFRKVLKCLKNNKVMVDVREDGIYTRLAGKESEGEAFTLHFANSFPFPPKEQPKPKEWEITRFHYISPDNCNHVHLKEDGKFYYGSGMFSGSLESHLTPDSKWKIHSVKRLSDNQIFTIGDNTTRGIIKAFNYIAHMDILEVEVGDQKTLLRTFDKLPRIPEKEEPKHIEVKSIKPSYLYGNMDNVINSVEYKIELTSSIPPKKYEPIKKAIEDIINYDKFLVAPLVPNQGYRIDIDSLSNVVPQLYTKEELMKAQQAAFYAGQALDTSRAVEKKDWFSPPRYPTFSDYYSTIKDNK